MLFFFLLACLDDNASLPSDCLSLAPDSKIRAGFPLVAVINSMVEWNEMSIPANPPFLYSLGTLKHVI